jgi:hypothetical protein
MRWPFFNWNWIAEAIERLAVSLACWALGWHRNTLQRVEADWAWRRAAA